MIIIPVLNLFKVTPLIIQKTIKVRHSHGRGNPWIEKITTIVRSPIKDLGDDGIVLVTQNLNLFEHQ